MKTSGVRALPRTAGAGDIMAVVQDDGGVVIEGFLSPAAVATFNEELDPHLAALAAGSRHDVAAIADFHGARTKRLTILVTRSRTWRGDHRRRPGARDRRRHLPGVGHLLDGRRAGHRDRAGEHGAGAAPRPGELPAVRRDGSGRSRSDLQLPDRADGLHRGERRHPGDPGQSPLAGLHRPRAARGHCPALLRAGDALFFSGKLTHGGGANSTDDQYRRAVAFTLCPGYLTGEEAYPFLVSRELAATLSPRVQGLIGFRSQYPKGTPGPWQVDYGGLADHLSAGA